jgi:hypothetical protein
VSLTGPWHVARLCIILAGGSLVGRPAGAQTTRCEPIAQRAGREFGCFIIARAELGALPRDSALYWHIDAFGTRSAVEVWHTLQGEQCLETPDGKLMQRAGDPPVMIGGGVPMILTGTGRGVRRSLVLILQDATKPRSMLATDWSPVGLCRP